MASSTQVTLDQRKVIGLAAAAAVIVGSLGPWRTLGIFRTAGTDGGGDGLYTLIGACLAAVLIFRDRASWLVLVIGVIACVVGIADASDIAGQSILGAQPSVGWGLIFVIAGAGGMVAWAVVDLRALRTDRRSTTSRDM